MQLNIVQYTPLMNIWWHEAISGTWGDAGGVQQATEIRDRTSLCSQGHAGGWMPVSVRYCSLCEAYRNLFWSITWLQMSTLLKKCKNQLLVQELHRSRIICVSVQNFKRQTFYYEGERLKEGKRRSAQTQTPICPTQWSRCRNGCVSTAVCSALGGREEI